MLLSLSDIGCIRCEEWSFVVGLLVVENTDHFFGLLWFESESLGLLLKDENTILEYYDVKGKLPVGAKIREAKQVGM